MTIRALGYSQSSDFDPFDPGRLCRGRERWITPWEREEGSEPAELTRLVITGASFDDDSARDALRGLSAAGVDATELVAAFFPGRKLLLFTEDGHPADIPDAAEGIELYDGHRAGGKERLPCVRWYAVLDSEDALRALAQDVVNERIKGLVVLPAKADLDALWTATFLLVGMANMDSPPSKYNPGALPDLLELGEAVVVFHRDKHGPVLGVYSKEPIEGAEAELVRIAEKSECLLVPFAIPPMLARWDRALFELRQTWEADREEPFPVPRSDTPSHWESRRNRRRRGRDRPEDEVAEEPVKPVEPVAEE